MIKITVFKFHKKSQKFFQKKIKVNHIFQRDILPTPSN